jgi:hypothetical protein
LGEDVEEQGDKWRRGEKIEKCNHCRNILTQNVITVCIGKNFGSTIKLSRKEAIDMNNHQTGSK